MLFNSLEFLFFLPIVFAIYWLLGSKKVKAQNLLLLLASYAFYGWWDSRFLILIGISTLVDYWAGIEIDKTTEAKKRKLYLRVSLLVNLGILGFFKYCNFFIDSWIELWGSLGYNMSPTTLNVILPVGISFYTFQTLSYTIDIYHNRIKPTHDLVSFAAFVSFFPQLVAGPIERASKLLPQLLNPRKFDYNIAIAGSKLILLGFFKKVVIADRLAAYVDVGFSNMETIAAIPALLAVLLFAFQLYCDFSGYSDIAIGIAKLFGIQLSINFLYPFFSKSLVDLWKRWHITLFSWFRDYIYIPLGGSKKGSTRAALNILVVFLVSGLWHGASWTFVLFGLLHGVLYLPYFFSKRKTEHRDSAWIKALKVLSTFCLFVLTLGLFRSPDFATAGTFYEKILTISQYPADIGQAIMQLRDVVDSGVSLAIALGLIVFLLLFEMALMFNKLPLKKYRFLEVLLYQFILYMIVFYGVFNSSSFIYFQF